MLVALILIAVTAITAIISLAGGFLLLSDSKFAKVLQKYGPFISIVVLLYAVFGDIIPEVLESEKLPVYRVAWLMFLGLAICTVLNLATKHLHQHGDKSKLRNKKQAYAMLIIDSLHTVLDGIAIGASFAANVGTGIATATATAAHEIPQEIGDFAIMIRSKMQKKYIIKLQVISALILIPSALVAYIVGESIADALPTLLSLIAGFLLYVAIGEIIIVVKPIWKRAKKGAN